MLSYEEMYCKCIEAVSQVIFVNLTGIPSIVINLKLIQNLKDNSTENF